MENSSLQFSGTIPFLIKLIVLICDKACKYVVSAKGSMFIVTV